LYWFCHISKWICHRYTCVPHPEPSALLPPHIIPLCDPIGNSPPGSPVPGILQARILEWVAISFSNAWKLKVKVKSLGRVRLFATPWTAAYQAPPSMGFSRQEYWSRLPFPSPMRACMLSCFSHVRLCDFMDSSPPGCPVHRILQERILKWVAISFSIKKVRDCAKCFTLVLPLIHTTSLCRGLCSPFHITY